MTTTSNEESSRNLHSSVINLSPLPRGLTSLDSCVTNIYHNLIAYAPPDKKTGIFTYDVTKDRWTMIAPYTSLFDPVKDNWIFTDSVVEYYRGMPMKEIKRMGFLRGLHSSGEISKVQARWKRVNIAFDHSTNDFFVTPQEYHYGYPNWVDPSAFWSLINADTLESKCWLKKPTQSQDERWLTFNSDIHCIKRSRDSHICVTMSENHLLSQVMSASLGTWRKLDLSKEYTSGGAVVQIQSQDDVEDMILLIGGWYSDRWSGSAHESGEVFKGTKKESGTWEWQLVSKGPRFEHINAVVTSDNKHVIVSVVRTEGHGIFDEDCIYILDIQNDFSWRKVHIDSPIKPFDIMGIEEGQPMMFRTGDKHKTDIMVHGFLRKLSRAHRMQTMPIVLVDLIQRYHSQELIHWVDENHHFAIPLEVILAANCEDVVIQDDQESEN